MRTITDAIAEDIDQLVKELRARDQVATNTVAAQQEFEHKPAAAAQLGFALLHVTLMRAYVQLLRHGLTVELRASAMDLELLYWPTPEGPRRCWRYRLHQAEIEAKYTHPKIGAVSERLTPPKTFDCTALTAWAQVRVKEAAERVLGLRSPFSPPIA